MFPLDEIDEQIKLARSVARNRNKRPRIGDYVRFPTGQLERLSHDWGDGFQTSPSGSIFLHANGQGEFSGGLNPSTPLDKMKLTNVHLPGSFWFFHHDSAGAGRGVYFNISCRVYLTTAEYTGYLGKDFQSAELLALKKQLDAEGCFAEAGGE